MDSCLSESTAKMATSSLELQPTCTEWKTHFRKVTGCNLGPVYQEQTVPLVKTLIDETEEENVHPVAGMKLTSTFQQNNLLFRGLQFLRQSVPVRSFSEPH